MYKKSILIFSIIFLYTIIVLILISCNKNIIKSHVNPIPKKMPKLKKNDIKILNFYMKEWETIITTQMHFNDLIIRFRSIILTSFATLIGAALVIFDLKEKFSPEFFLPVLIVILLFWILAFFLDFFYYHHLLLGAVSQALKFDESHYFKKLGLFGMTSCIKGHISPLLSNIFLFGFYTIPVVVLIILYILFYTK